MTSKYIFSLILPSELEKPLKNLAKKRGLSITKLIQSVIEKELKEEGV